MKARALAAILYVPPLKTREHRLEAVHGRDYMIEEHRHSGRRKTLFGGVLFNDDGAQWDCSIVDISETGAKVRSRADLEAGSFINMKITKFNDLRRAEVMWIRDGNLGLRFVIKIDKHQKEMAEFFKLVGKYGRP